jgi:hypothetical protein
VSDEVLDSLVDESAPLARLNHAVNRLDRRFRQYNVDALAHGIEINDLM